MISTVTGTFKIPKSMILGFEILPIKLTGIVTVTIMGDELIGHAFIQGGPKKYG